MPSPVLVMGTVAPQSGYLTGNVSLPQGDATSALLCRQVEDGEGKVSSKWRDQHRQNPRGMKLHEVSEPHKSFHVAEKSMWVTGHEKGQGEVRDRSKRVLTAKLRRVSSC